jgi:hypothetical protein
MVDKTDKENSRTYSSTRRWCFELMKKTGDVEFEKTLTDRLHMAKDKWETIALMEDLASFLEGRLRHQEAQKLLQDVIVLNDTSAIPIINLTCHFLYVQERPDLALHSITNAELEARKSGHFLRHALATKARIALAMDRYDILEECLREIPKIVVKPGIRDVGMERDFFDRADKTRIPHDVTMEFERYWESKNRSS